MKLIFRMMVSILKYCELISDLFIYSSYTINLSSLDYFYENNKLKINPIV